MKYLALAAAVVVLGSGHALAQSSTTTSPATGGAAPTTQNQPSGTSGASGTSQPPSPGRGLSVHGDQIRQKLEGQGYSQIQLHDDPANPNGFAGTAHKGGKQVGIQIHPDGTLTER
jgi:hypothetical protein